MHAAATGLCLALIALPVRAEDVKLDTAEFLALMDGRTAHFSAEGKAYGSEAYHPDKRVIWRYPDGQCLEGQWREIGGYLCFQYDHISCWHVFRTEEGAHYATSSDGFSVDFESIEDGAFDCQGVPLS